MTLSSAILAVVTALVPNAVTSTAPAASFAEVTASSAILAVAIEPVPYLPVILELETLFISSLARGLPPA